MGIPAFASAGRHAGPGHGSGGAWLASDQLDRVLDAYGIPRVRTIVADGPGGAADAQATIGGRVVVKLGAPMHRRGVGAVRTDVASPQAAAEACPSHR